MDINNYEKSMKAYDDATAGLMNVLGEWLSAAGHLRNLGWTVQDWERWVNECQCGTMTVPEFGLVQSFQAQADAVGLAQQLRGKGDDVATCLACLWLWVSLDEMVPPGEAPVLGQIVSFFEAPSKTKAA